MAKQIFGLVLHQLLLSASVSKRDSINQNKYYSKNNKGAGAIQGND